MKAEIQLRLGYRGPIFYPTALEVFPLAFSYSGLGSLIGLQEPSCYDFPDKNLARPWLHRNHSFHALFIYRIHTEIKL